MFRLIDAGRGLFLLGNHDLKLARLLAGQPVRTRRRWTRPWSSSSRAARAGRAEVGARASLATARRRAVRPWRLPHRDAGGAARPSTAWSAPQGALARALYGEPTGRTQPDGYPERSLRWVDRIPAGLTVYCGHDRRSTDGRPYVRRGAAGGTAVFLDTGAGKGGHLSWIDL